MDYHKKIISNKKQNENRGDLISADIFIS